jgi:hypothetical protein
MGHTVVVCLNMCYVDMRFRCVFGGPERSVAPQFCGNSPPRFLSCRPASRRRQPRVRQSHIEPHPMLRALQTQARPFSSTRTAAARHQFVPISIGARHFTTRSPNKMSDIAPQIPPEPAAATMMTAAPPTSSADKQKKQQHPHANANTNAKQKPKAPPKKEVRILMLHGLFTPPSAPVLGQLWPIPISISPHIPTFLVTHSLTHIHICIQTLSLFYPHLRNTNHQERTNLPEVKY